MLNSLLRTLQTLSHLKLTNSRKLHLFLKRVERCLCVCNLRNPVLVGQSCKQWWHLIQLNANDCCARFGSTYPKIGTIQRRFTWPLGKDDTQINDHSLFFWPVQAFSREREEKVLISQSFWCCPLDSWNHRLQGRPLDLGWVQYASWRDVSKGEHGDHKALPRGKRAHSGCSSCDMGLFTLKHIALNLCLCSGLPGNFAIYKMKEEEQKGREFLLLHVPCARRSGRHRHVGYLVWSHNSNRYRGLCPLYGWVNCNSKRASALPLL